MKNQNEWEIKAASFGLLTSTLSKPTCHALCQAGQLIRRVTKPWSHAQGLLPAATAQKRIECFCKDASPSKYQCSLFIKLLLNQILPICIADILQDRDKREVRNQLWSQQQSYSSENEMDIIPWGTSRHNVLPYFKLCISWSVLVSTHRLFIQY